MTQTLRLTRRALAGSRRAEQSDPPVLRNNTSGARRDEMLEVTVPEALAAGSDEVSVLHVDDNPEYTELVRTMLEEEYSGYAVSTATGAVEALNLLSGGRYDCVVSDYEMPTTDGLELLELVRDRYPDLPFILFTGAGDERLASEAIEAGVTDYVRKHGGTQQYDILVNRIDNAVSQYRTRQQFWDALSWYQRLVEQDFLGVFVVRNGEFVFVNERFAELCGRDRDTLVGASRADLSGEVVGLVDAALAPASETLPVRESVTTGDTCRVELRAGAVRYDGTPARLGVLWTDDP